jgi:GntR family transcriptional regulator
MLVQPRGTTRVSPLPTGDHLQYVGAVYSVHIVMHSVLTISQADGRPMYLQIVEQVRRRIALGDWPSGAEMPSIRALAASTRVSVITIKRAYFELEREGVIVTRQGRGTFVAEGAGLGRQLREQELDEHLGKAAEVGRELGLTAGELVGRLREVARRKGLDGTGEDG